jgi:hypothetical protein
VSTVAGASAPVTVSATGTFGTRRPEAASTSTVTSAGRPLTSFGGSTARTRYGPA